MTRRRITIIAGVIALALAFALGRWTARPPALELDEELHEEIAATTTTETHATETASSARQTDASATVDSSELRIEEHGAVVIHHPDGRREERAPSRVIVATDTHAAEQVRELEEAERQREEHERQVEVVEVVREVVRHVEVREPPTWMVGPSVGTGSVGLLYGAQGAAHLGDVPLLGWPVYVTAAGRIGPGGEWMADAGVMVAPGW